MRELNCAMVGDDGMLSGRSSRVSRSEAHVLAVGVANDSLAYVIHSDDRFGGETAMFYNTRSRVSVCTSSTELGESRLGST